ncbi:MAG: pantoate--beta-alanine ligase [Campylobacterales bacterium]
MQIAKTINELKELRAGLKGTVGFVPTMGALHSGHLSLIRRSKEECESSVVSIFVNPTQFLEGEDFEAYPKKQSADLDICRRAGVNLVFIPRSDELYFGDDIRVVAPKCSGYLLEGAKRPGHFDGVLSVVLKLLNLVTPQKAYFGQKDAQQLLLIEKMVRELFLDVEIVGCPTVREDSGLALSSRNEYLSSEDKKEALKLSFALKKGAKLLMDKETSAIKIKQSIISALEGVDIEYVEIVDRELKRIDVVKKGESILLGAIKVNGVRLIDNIWV